MGLCSSSNSASTKQSYDSTATPPAPLKRYRSWVPNLPANRSNRAQLKTRNVPALVACQPYLHSRQEQTAEVMKLISQAVEDPDRGMKERPFPWKPCVSLYHFLDQKGFVAIEGADGVGKTTLMANLLTDETTASLLFDEIGIHDAVWINCAQWRSSFDTVAFKRQLQDLTPCDSISSIVQNLSKSNQHFVILIFDNVSNADLLQFLRDTDWCQNVIYFVITPDVKKLDQELIRVSYHLSAMESNEVALMLSDTFKLRGKLDQDQIDILADLAKYSPLQIASLMKAHFSSSREVSQERFKAISQIPSGRLLSELFKLAIGKMKPEQKNCYYAFLFFEPSESVNVQDLAAIWQLDQDEANELCFVFEENRLLQRGNSDAYFTIHQLLYQVALEDLTNDGKFSGDGAILSKMRHGINAKDDHCCVLSMWAVIGSCLAGGRWQLLTKIAETLIPDLTKGVQCFEEANSDGSVQAERNGYLESSAYLKKKYPTALREINFKLGETPLIWAARNGHFEVVEKMVDIWPDANKVLLKESRESTIWFAAKSGHLPTVKLLHKKFPNSVAILNKNGQTPLHVASQEGHLDTVKFLAGEYPDATKIIDEDGRTPLSLAVDLSKLEVAKFLVERHLPSVKVVDKQGLTPLSIVALRDNCVLVEFLHSKYPQAIEIKDKNGRTPLHWAAFSGSTDVVKFVYEQRPESIKVVDGDGLTTLALAAKGGHVETAKFLYEKYPNALKIRARNGKTPLDFADQQNVADFLRTLS